MTIQNALDNRRWAETMFQEIKLELKDNHSINGVESYYYLQNWIKQFDSILRGFTCYNENHIKYKEGFAKLRKLSKSL